jgi:predicted secreted protein
VKLNLIIKLLLLIALSAVLIWLARAWWTGRDTVRPMRVRLGSEFILKLESNATTGYQWQIARPLVTKKVRLISQKYLTPKNARIGQGGTEIWTFKAVGKGQTRIMFKYVRPWEKNVAPIELKTFLIEVR